MYNKAQPSFCLLQRSTEDAQPLQPPVRFTCTGDHVRVKCIIHAFCCEIPLRGQECALWKARPLVNAKPLVVLHLPEVLLSTERVMVELGLINVVKSKKASKTKKVHRKFLLAS